MDRPGKLTADEIVEFSELLFNKLSDQLDLVYALRSESRDPYCNNKTLDFWHDEAWDHYGDALDEMLEQSGWTIDEFHEELNLRWINA